MHSTDISTRVKKKDESNVFDLNDIQWLFDDN